MASRSFGGAVGFIPGGATTSQCYPARYPIYTAPSTTSPVTLTFTGGPAATTVKWVVNGATAATQRVAASGGTLGWEVPIGASGTSYVRAELINGANRYAMTQAVMFVPVAGLPSSTSIGVTGVVTATGQGYTKTMIKGIIGATYSTAQTTLGLTLANPVGALVTIGGDAPDPVTGVNVDGTSITAATSQADFDAAATSCWYQQGAALSVKVLHSLGTHAVQILFASATGDTTPPTVPTAATARQLASGAVQVSWGASSDNVRVAGYTVYRDGTALGTVDASTLTYLDATVVPSTSYSYTVDAYDAVHNHSAQSNAARLTTAGPPVTQTLPAAADSYVSSSAPDKNYGTAASLKVDADAIYQSYLRFAIRATAGQLSSAKLLITATSSQSTGYDVYAVADDAWTEQGITGITWTNKPAMGALLGSSGPVTAGQVTSVDITAQLAALLNSGGDVNLGLRTTSTTALSLASKNSSTPPQLVLVSTGPITPPGVPSGLAAAQTAPSTVTLTWNPASDGHDVASYTAYRNGTPLATVPGASTTYDDMTVAAGTTYAYQLLATDSAGTSSALSDAVSITTATPPDPIPPSVPGGVSATQQTPRSPVVISWTASTDNVGVTGYQVLRNSVVLTTVLGGSTTAYTDATVQSATSYSYQVVACDAAGNTSAPSTAALITTGDSAPPSTPTGVSATQQSPAAPVVLAWTAATDDVAVTGYQVLRNGTQVAAVGAAVTTWSDATVQPSTTYSYQVAATDAAGNASAASAAVSITTQAKPTTTVTVPAEADTYVDSAAPTKNYGTATLIRVDADGQRSYLRFAIVPTAGTVVSAVLRVYANSAQASGYDVYAVADTTWSETAVTWTNAPAAAQVKTGSSGRVTAATWTSVDITALVATGLVNAGGKVSVNLATTNSTGLSMSSRQGANPPQLVITVA